MRTTLTIDPEVADRLREELASGQRSLKAIINDALKRGLGIEAPPRREPFRIAPHSSRFLAGIDTAKLNQLADEIEASETQAKRQESP